MDKAQAKAKAEMARRSKARKLKQQTDAEWRTEISRKLEDLSKLSELRKDMQRITVVLEKLAGIESQDSEEEQFSWLESERKEREMQEKKEKGKQREERIDGAEEEEEVGEQEEENGMEDVEEGSSSLFPVAFSVSTGIL